MAEPMGTLYLQVADHLRQQISRGELAIGDPIPSTSKLCEQFGVSATVARAAVKELQSAGLVQGQPGKAVYVIATPEKVEQSTADLQHLADQVDHMREDISELSERMGSSSASDSVDGLRAEVAELRRQVATLQGHLIDLYARTGQPYPHEAQSKSRRGETSRRRKAASS
jgi:DNA-binding GntR family transcriptional regulator